MNEPIISVSGLRGLVPKQFTPLVAINYVSAYASTMPEGKVILSRDGRSSGEMIALAVTSTLIGHGHEVIDIGTAATPTVGVQVRVQRAAGGIQISASHNPIEYNGLKLFGSDGRVLKKAKGDDVLKSYRAGRTRWNAVQELGKVRKLDDPHTAHKDKILATVNVKAIQQRKFRVLLDSNHGAGSALGRLLLESLGCEVTVLGEQPDGQFEHVPEPIADNLGKVCEAVANGSFNVGFCQDPDADRLSIIDEKGNFVGEEMTLAFCLMQFLPKNSGIIVTNCASSSYAKFLAKKHKVAMYLSPVGEANVVEKMMEHHAVFGGEGNGGPIDPRVGYVRDSFVGMALVLDLMASTKQPISALASQMPSLAMYKDKIQLAGSLIPKYIERLGLAIEAPNISRQDGLRWDWEDRWLLVRPSNTEPIIRLIAEAPTLEDARKLCENARRFTKGL